MDVRDLDEELARPGPWPGGAAPDRRVETHISVLWFVGERVYKLKKAVDLGFLDYRALDARHRFCQEEVRLNARLAPGVYLGVAAVVRDASGALRVGEPGAPASDALEWAVVMRRLPAGRMLAALVERGEVDGELLERLAVLLADFHAAAERGPRIDAWSGLDAVAERVRGNFTALAAFDPEVASPLLCAHLERRATRFLAEQRALMEQRVRDGRACDGHGDLHAENVCVLDDRIVAYDCIEFRPEFRAGDVACDLGFLTMDLALRGFPAFAQDLARRYAERAGDPGLEDVLGFYEDYRALVRAKVAGLTGLAEGAGADLRRAKAGELRRYVHLACRRTLPAGLVLTSGLPASGKSTLADHLAPALDAAHLSSDLRRKSLAGLAPNARVRPGVDAGLYSPESRARTYASLLESAAHWLDAGRRVVVDATFSTREQRAPFLELACARRVPLLLVWVDADEDETRRRLLRRAADPEAHSDADLAVWERARATFEPPLEVGEGALLRVRSGARSLEEETGALLERWLAAEPAP